MEYFAFGETFIQEHRSSNNSPYKFNGKELDEETGWYYYGARYYDPRTSIWLSVDPLAETTMTPYQYTYQNPIRYIDPTGMSGEDPPMATYVITYGSGWYRPEDKGKTYDVGDGFKLSAEAMKKNLIERGIPESNIVLAYTPNEKTFLEVVNKEYDTGKIQELYTYSHGTNNSLNFGGTQNDNGGDSIWFSAYDSENNQFEHYDLRLDNFADNVKVVLRGCNLGGYNEKDMDTSHAQFWANFLGLNSEIQAYVGGGGAEFKQKNGKNVYDGSMIRSADKKSQQEKLTTFRQKEIWGR